MSKTAIDFEHLDRQTDGDRELAGELLSLFSEQCARHLQTIQGDGDAGTRRDAAHTLRGAAQAIGAWRVAEAAATIENQLGAPAGRCDEDALTALIVAAAEARAAIARRDSSS
jgi:HPt (histidine-containing phosphotransfer) domain-containing protein